MIPGIYESQLGGVPPSAGGGGARLLSGISVAGQSSNLELCLDAGDYISGLWADESGQGNHFRLGSTTGVDVTDPTFHGTPGAGTSNEYFTFDGGDYFEIASGANPTFIANMHKDNAQFSVLSLIYQPTGGHGVLLSTENGGTEIGIGIDLYPDGTSMRLFALNGNPASYYNTVLAGAGISDGWCAVHLSINEGVLNGSTLSLNGAVVSVFTATYISPSASAATRLVRIGARGGGADFNSNNVLLAGMGSWSRALSGADHAAIYTQIKTPFALL